MRTSRDLLAALIAFNTVSRESNLAPIEFVRAYLAGFGVDSQLLFSADGCKANLYARLGPSGPRPAPARTRTGTSAAGS